ncbi:MAG: hypothetical protein WDN45_01795 [Caulobacteraceae bacterium]
MTDFDSWDRCISRGFPASMLPFRYNNGVQILQAPRLCDHQPGDDPRRPASSLSTAVRRRPAPSATGWA